MLTNMFAQDTHLQKPVFKEGDLYKVLSVEGHIFRLYYGYYEDYERNNPAAEPMPIYPDFLTKPQFTKAGNAFVTKMQDACAYYEGAETAFRECAECSHYKHGEDLIGICICPKNKASP